MYFEFKNVVDENIDDVLALKVACHQNAFIETTKASLDEAEKLELWRPVGIYFEGTLVGFAMYGLWIYEGDRGRVWLDRFLIDEKFQGKGYGKASLIAILEKIFDEYSYDEIFLSIYDNNAIAIKIYQNIGFVFNGELDINGESVMVLRKGDF